MNNAVHITQQGPVTLVTLSRPHVRNAVDAATARKLYDAFLDFDMNPQAALSSAAVPRPEGSSLMPLRRAPRRPDPAG